MIVNDTEQFGGDNDVMGWFCDQQMLVGVHVTAVMRNERFKEKKAYHRIWNDG